MSRIIVKGLPTYLTDEALREHFAKRLVHTHHSTHVAQLLTDARVVRDRAGQSRRFAFLGYRDAADAEDAVRYFDGSYIGTARIAVQQALSFADPAVPQGVRERKREAYRRMREREQQLQEESAAPSKKQKQKESIDAEISRNQQLQEFIETMKPSANVGAWEKPAPAQTETVSENGDGDADDDAPAENPLLSQARALHSDNAEDSGSDGEYAAFGGESGETGEEEEPMMRLDEVQTQDAADVTDVTDAPGADGSLAQDGAVSDLDWLKQRRVRIRDSDAPVAAPVPVENTETAASVEPLSPRLSPEEVAISKIRESSRLFLRNILYSATEQDFTALFSPFGTLTEVHVALDTRTGQSKGFAYVQFADPDAAVRAYIELDKQIFQGRLLHILPADAKKSHRLDEFDLKNMPLKKQRELKKKAHAARQTFAWNSLYMNQDAVLSSVASRLGMQKAELVDPENSNSAVKQALAEAHVIGDVRKYFESKGVDLAKFGALKSPDQRDDCVILVKNFPYGTTREDIGELFLPFGKLERLLMPPAGTIAIVQYRDRTAARAAFTKLSFKRYKDGIIYLEKGPKDCFTRAASADESVLAEEKAEDANAKEAKASVSDLMESKATAEDDNTTTATQQDDEGVADGPTVSIFIKNLNFSTTTPQLGDRFKKFSGYVVAQVKTKPNPKDKTRPLSMGFGFAEFRTKEQANAVIAAMDGSVIDGHKIQLKLSHRQGNASSSSNASAKRKGAKGASGKIIVKNLPFEATRKDVFELFNSFGQLKSVRVPKKFDKSARGFAFVEFLLPKEAENAMDQLQGVHLLGRRLVMQYAEHDAEDAEEEIARMTKKVRKQVATAELSSMRSSGGRKRLDMDDGNEDELGGF
ncbi:RNA-binding ribosome biosynthesis protein [Maudiozyma humilis]|uniref:Multiple RNA-binding domain-containing protein 1 n=1 Tax=Maudiozyma humilis TaxID=51915 RepID=A0AAV5S134_MAUHU|nr:RNA-binding ribosome biosynthesis protein [Kazachstania humilis]